MPDLERRPYYSGRQTAQQLARQLLLLLPAREGNEERGGRKCPLDPSFPPSLICRPVGRRPDGREGRSITRVRERINAHSSPPTAERPAAARGSGGQ